MSAPKAMVFDVGRVLIDWRPDEVYARRIPDPERRAAFWALGVAAWNRDFDAGAPMLAALEQKARAHPDFAEEILDWRRRWDEMVGPVIDGAAALLRAVKARGVPVFALTNFSAETWPMAQEMFPVLREFDLAVVSGREGVIKPDAAIYDLLETRSGLRGDALMFTDDSPANIAAAKARGWRAHLFEGADGLRAAMRAEGML